LAGGSTIRRTERREPRGLGGGVPRKEESSYEGTPPPPGRLPRITEFFYHLNFRNGLGQNGAKPCVVLVSFGRLGRLKAAESILGLKKVGCVFCDDLDVTSGRV
jgi:hypothetical protein